MSEIATQETKAISRPPHVLVPLIKEDLARARKASEQASLPYWVSAGEKMIEARPQVPDWASWLRRNFGIGERQARTYMSEARKVLGDNAREFSVIAGGSALPPRSLRGHIQTSSNPKYGKYKSDIKKISEQARREAARLRDAELTRRQEREAEQKLALRLIDIGYKTLAKELHADKGGSHDAMARLNRVRARLKQSA